LKGKRRILTLDPGGFQEAAEAVRRGGLVVYPTDTVYGLGCDPFNEDAVRKVFEAKRRERRPLPVLGSTLSDLDSVCIMNQDTASLAHLFWPGPVSIILPKHPQLPSIVTAGIEEVAVRIPASLAATELMRLIPGPLVGTSANISGQPSPSSLDEVPQEILEASDVCIDGGRTRHGLPSTVIKPAGKTITVTRRGAMSAGEIASMIRGAGLDYEVVVLEM